MDSRRFGKRILVGFSGLVWSLLPLRSWVSLVFTKSELVPLFATTTWSVWFHRNKTRLNENARSLGQIVGFAQDYVRDFKSLKCNSPTVRAAAPKVWSPPV